MRRAAFALQAWQAYRVDEQWQRHVSGAISPPPERYLTLVADSPGTTGSASSNAIALANRSLIYLSEGRVDNAIELSARSVALDPDNAAVRVVHGAVLSETGRFEEAINAYDQAVSLDPRKQDKIALFRGIASAQVGRLNEAIADYRLALTVDDNDLEALTNLGVAYIKSGRSNEAVGAYGKAVRLAPEAAELWLIDGFVLGSSGRPQDAIEAFRSATHSEAWRPAAYTSWGIALVRLGRPDEAVEVLLTAVTVAPNDPDIRLVLGTALDMADRTDEALRAYEDTLAISAFNPETHFLYAGALARVGRFDDAIREYNVVIGLAPKHADVHYMRGLALAKENRLEEAAESFAKAIEDNPLNADAHLNLGRACLGRGRLPDAVEAFRRAVEIDANTTNLLNYAFALLRIGHASVALEVLEAAGHLQPKSAYFDLYMGQAFAELNKLDEAIAAYSLSLRPSREQPLQTGDRVQACRMLMIALRLKAQSFTNVSDLYYTLTLYRDVARDLLPIGNAALSELLALDTISAIRLVIGEDDELRQLSSLAQDDARMRAIVDALRSLGAEPDGLPQAFRKIVRQLMAPAPVQEVKRDIVERSRDDADGRRTHEVNSEFETNPTIQTGLALTNLSFDPDTRASQLLASKHRQRLPVNIAEIALSSGLKIFFVAFRDDRKTVSELYRTNDGRYELHLATELRRPWKRWYTAQHLYAAVTDSVALSETSPGESTGSPAGRFARSLLMPENQVLPYWRLMRDQRAMAAAFDVPEEKIVERLAELGIKQELPPHERIERTAGEPQGDRRAGRFQWKRRSVAPEQPGRMVPSRDTSNGAPRLG